MLLALQFYPTTLTSLIHPGKLYRLARSLPAANHGAHHWMLYASQCSIVCIQATKLSHARHAASLIAASSRDHGGACLPEDVLLSGCTGATSCGSRARLLSSRERAGAMVPLLPGLAAVTKPAAPMLSSVKCTGSLTCLRRMLMAALITACAC